MHLLCSTTSRFSLPYRHVQLLPIVTPSHSSGLFRCSATTASSVQTSCVVARIRHRLRIACDALLALEYSGSVLAYLAT